MPMVDVVIIGLNSAKTLKRCIDSVCESNFPRDKLAVYYADGGSTDGSLEIAKNAGAIVLSVIAETPTPGRQRNVGWQAGNSDLVQFLDSDTIMDRDWLDVACAQLSDEIGAVCGKRNELFPEKSIFNWIGDQEWNGTFGLVQAFGGDVLIRRSVLEKTAGYDNDLIAGEDPELSYRVRQIGYKIVRLDAQMTRHDLAMFSLRQYWKRAYRTGHAYAEVHDRHHDFWRKETMRIVSRAGLFAFGVLLLPFCVLSWYFALFFGFFVLFLIRPRLTHVGYFQDKFRSTRKLARIYAWHASLVVIPQFCGMIRFKYGKLFSHPLTNKKVLKVGV